MLLANATLPLTVPATCGANVTVNPELCPGARLKGVVSPLIVKPAPAAVAPVMVTELPPEFVMVTGWFWLLPTVTLPKLMLFGFSARAPGATPVPVTAMLRFAFVAVDTMLRLPVTAPAEVGAKFT